MATAQQPLSPEVHHLTKKPVEGVDGVAPINLLSIALQNNAAIDVIERLAALQEKAMLREAEIAFNDALSRIQEAIKSVAPDLLNPQTSSKYASYGAIDRVIRPIYTREGMSLSFSHADCSKAEHVRVLCFASLGAYTRTYQMDMPTDGKGARGGDVMTKTHATATADSYAKRYLVKDIFNIAIGEYDLDGNGATNGDLAKYVERLKNAKTWDELYTVFKEVYPAVNGNKNAQLVLIEAKDARKRELR